MSTSKTFIVSGAGSGIGQQIALTIAKASADNRIVLLGRTASALENTRALLPNSPSHQIAVADVQKPSTVRDAFRELGLNKQNVVGVMPNAGIGGENVYGESDRWGEIIGTNLTGAYVLANEALPFLRAAKDQYKHIVVTSSILSRLGVPGYSAYCASKAGLLGLIRSWAAEFAKDKILVNAICPGWVETEMAKQGVRAMAEHQKISYEDSYRQQMNYVPLGKMSRPEEIGELVAFLVSGKQNSITGQSLDINNGALMA